MNPSGYTLDFVIPQGPTGPSGTIGPTGPANGLNAYGGKYNNTSQTLNLSIGSATQIPLKQLELMELIFHQPLYQEHFLSALDLSIVVALLLF